MSFTRWLSNRLNVSRRSAFRFKTSSTRARFRPRLEAMEDRWAPSTVTVTNNHDSGAGSLRAAVAHAHKGDTINFAASMHGQTITLTSGELLINQNITIAGPADRGVTISGNHASRVFEMAKSTSHISLNLQVNLSGLTISDGFTNGSSPYYIVGGGILNEGTLALNNCTLSGNYAPQGGAVHNEGALTAANCLFTNNGLSNNGGISGEGGAIQNYGNLTVSASTLSHNSAGSGGAIWNDSGTATINAGTALSDNHASTGGAISNIYGTLNIDGCTLSGNSAVLGGGVSDSNGKNIQINGCTITGNSATNSGGGIVIGNSGGGTIAFTVTVSNCTLTGNSASQGAGIYLNDHGGDPFTVTVSGCTFAGNSANEGGGIYNSSTRTGALSVSNSLFSANSLDNIFGFFDDRGGNTFNP